MLAHPPPDNPSETTDCDTSPHRVTTAHLTPAGSSYSDHGVTRGRMERIVERL